MKTFYLPLLVYFFTTNFVTAQVDSQCFAKSNDYAGEIQDWSTSQTNDLIKSAQFKNDMRISKITGCTDSQKMLNGVWITLKSAATGEILKLETLGFETSARRQTCTDLAIDDGEYIKTLEVTYDLVTKYRIMMLSVITTNGDFRIFGEAESNTQSSQATKSWKFNEEYQLIGLYGTSNRAGIGSIGVIILKTACIQEVKADDSNKSAVGGAISTTEENNQVT